MDHDHISEQAEDVATLLRSLLRELSVGLDDPAVDLPLAQLRVCTVLYGGPRPMSSLGRELGVSLSAITQIADRLERAGLVTRVAKGGDRRVRCLQLTHRGEKMMRLHEEARIQRMSAALEHLNSRAAARGDGGPADVDPRLCRGERHDGDIEQPSPHFSKSKVML